MPTVRTPKRCMYYMPRKYGFLFLWGFD